MARIRRNGRRPKPHELAPWGMYRHDGSKPGSHAQSVWDWGLGPMEQWRHEE